MDIKQIENIFRNSNDSNQLFDAFQVAIENQIEDEELYKVLLSNYALSSDELCMYTEKIISLFPSKAFTVLLYAGDLFAVRSDKIESQEKALQYYIRAAKDTPNSYKPFKRAIAIFNYEIDLSINSQIIKFIDDGIPIVDKKSILYKTLAKHYKKIGDDDKYKNYESLAEKAASRE